MAFYATHNRIRSGTHEAMLDAAYSNWWDDVKAGKQSLLIASRGEEASALAARARLQRVATGDVQAEGVRLHDGNIAGVGDWIVTRANMRLMQLNDGRDFVKNGDTWTVTAISPDGSITARHLRHGAEMRLPAVIRAMRRRTRLRRDGTSSPRHDRRHRPHPHHRRHHS